MTAEEKIAHAREMWKFCRDTGECGKCEMGLLYPGVIQCRLKILGMIMAGMDEQEERECQSSGEEKAN